MALMLMRKPDTNRAHEDIARLLINQGADVTAQFGSQANALQAASSAGHLSMVKLLIHHGALIDVPGGFYGSAVQAAYWKGIEQVVEAPL
ncbi:hypothetical protein SNOG_16170 [Parastagonospora nodorum SN15]|uniref:Uncharacterized protein n=1 Tax=Phaeosphaeria nodorum (strain SN15 / ATCC MYA-4574 / FGSC 10173) TaxID=321614 RepID=Q0TW49_PHANO|nr:hypothetical protein SNOG_16170 [Parastagonospora nodorum SN15]EAT76354.1 hypothetical protein SNOG_16170 [Parastagonospora nodorum SN15]